jgi:hypothetical protein
LNLFAARHVKSVNGPVRDARRALEDRSYEMSKFFRISLAAAAICAVPMATIAVAADHRDGVPTIITEPPADNNDSKKAKDQATPEHAAINTWRKTRVLIRRPPRVRPSIVD